MASVTLDFVPPIDPDIVALRIYEAVAAEGPFNEIERTTSVGTAPNYITRYTTTQATDVQNWFTIAWENADAVISPMSQPIQGGTESLVSEVAQRVMQRDPSISEAIAVQEAEATVEMIVGGDPYATDVELTYNQLAGATYLTLARIYMFTSATTQTSTEDYTAGIVSEKSGSSSSTGGGRNAIADLLRMASASLGLGGSRVAQMAELPSPCNSNGKLWEVDQSRLLMVEKV